jgi:hypothetical protein
VEEGMGGWGRRDEKEEETMAKKGFEQGSVDDGR